MWYFLPDDWTFIEFFGGKDQLDYTINTTLSAVEDNQKVLIVNSSIIEEGEAGIYQFKADSNNKRKAQKQEY